MAFEDAVNSILHHEGGFVDDPRDPRGMTKYGISKRAYPHEDIENLTVERAKELYKRDYWDKIRGDELPEPVALVVFDSAVNQGITRATVMMQKALGVTTDGVFGEQTLTAAKEANRQTLVERFMAERIMHYASLSTFSVYGRGWMRRVINIAMEAAR